MDYELSEEKRLLATNICTPPTFSISSLYSKIGAWDERYIVTCFWCELYQYAQRGWEAQEGRGLGGGGGRGVVESFNRKDTHIHV